MAKIIGILFFLLFVFSCKNPSQENSGKTEDVSITWDQSDTGSLSQIATDIKYIPLETNADGLFDGSRLVKIIIKNEKILIFDRYVGNSILMFDINGRFDRRIGKRGEGPGEYILLTGFTADDHYIYAVNHPRGKIIVYDFQGNFIKELKTPNHPTDIAALDNGDFLLTNHPELYPADGSCKLLLVGKDMRVKSELFPRDENDSELAMNYYFTDCGNNVTYQNYVQDKVIAFDKKDGRHKIYNFDFPNKVPQELRAKTDFMRGGYQYLSHKPALLSGKYINGQLGGKSFVIDIKDGGVYFPDKNSLPITSNTLYKDYVVSIFIGKYYKNAVENGWPRAPKEMDEFFMADDENVGLLLYKLKQ